MSVNNLAFLALDTSCDTGVVALCDRDSVYYSETLPHKLSHGQLLCPAIDHSLKALKAYGLVLAGVFVGLGPGSFVGLRVALATALGFSFGRSLPLMGFCSHRALAHSLAEADNLESICVAMKASGDLCYLTSFHDPMGQTKLVHKQDLWAELAAHSQLLSNLHLEQAESQSTITITKTHGPSAEGMRKAICYKLSQVGQLIDESDHIKPNYIKGANVSLPKDSANKVISSRLVPDESTPI